MSFENREFQLINQVSSALNNKQKKQSRLFVNAWFDIHKDRVIGQFQWHGKDMPFGITSEYLENELFFRGKLGYFFDGLDYGIYPYLEGGNNLLNLPRWVKPMGYNGAQIGRNRLNPYGNDVALLYARPFIAGNVVTPSSAKCTPFITAIDELFARLMVNIRTSGKKIVAKTADPAQAKSLQKEMDKYLSGDDAFIIVSEALALDTSLATVPEFEKFFDAIANFDGMLARMEGMQGVGIGNEKKERLTVSEVDNSNETVNKIIERKHAMRQRFCDEVKLKFGKEIKVERCY